MILTTAIIKGGAGKSTTAAAIAQAAAMEGKKVLCIDLEPQANLSFFLKADSTKPGTYELLKRKETLTDLIQATPQKIDIVTGSAELATISTRQGSGDKLREELRPMKKYYDLIIIDTAPALNDLVYNALLASDYLIIPLFQAMTHIKGALQIHDIAEALREEAGHGAKVAGAVINDLTLRSNIDKKMFDLAKRYLQRDNVPLLGSVRHSCALEEAQALQKNLFEHAPKSYPATDYKKIYDKIMQICK